MTHRQRRHSSLFGFIWITLIFFTKIKMKFALVILALCLSVSADVSHLVNPDASAAILRQNLDIAPDNSGYQYDYETSNGISAQEAGQLKNVGRPDEALAVQGSNSYTAPDGSFIQTVYTADENGYQPQGAHLPVAPPIPDYILRALEWIRTHPSQPAQNAQPQRLAPSFRF